MTQRDFAERVFLVLVKEYARDYIQLSQVPELPGAEVTAKIAWKLADAFVAAAPGGSTHGT